MQKLLTNFQFTKAGDLVLRKIDMQPIFEFDNNFLKGDTAKDEGWVYLWIAFTGNDLTDVFYVGKAGKTLKARCNQHVGGFRGGSTKGQENSKNIRNFLEADKTNRLELHARKSAVDTILQETQISLCEAEEIAMIKKLRGLGYGLWNKT